MNRFRLIKVLKIALFGTVAVAAVSFVVMNLWNVLMPGIFAARTINFWQALGLLILSKILFGGFRSQGGGRLHWRRRLVERWEKMTPEEREKFKEGMRAGCGRRRNVETAGRGAEAQA